MADSNKLKQSIMLHEGLKLFPYQDTTGNITIGYGTNLSAGITACEAEGLLCGRLLIATGEAEAQPWWQYVKGNDARERALIECVYNLGIAGFNNFHKAIAALGAGDFKSASEELLNSLWAKQVGKRAEVIAGMILNGSDFMS